MNNVNEKIAREICGWKKKWIDAGDGDKYWQWEDKHELTEYSEAYPFEPSSDIAHAIAALECLPKSWGWLLYKGSENYDCQIWKDDAPTKVRMTVGVSVRDKTLCGAICKALLDKQVLSAVKEARG